MMELTETLCHVIITLCWKSTQRRLANNVKRRTADGGSFTEITNWFSIRWSHASNTSTCHLLMTDAMDQEALPLTTVIKDTTQKVFDTVPCMFQINLCLAQLQAHSNNSDIITMAATGSGKTLCFLMPLLFNSGKLIIIVTTLNLLGEQFVSIIKAAGFEAIAVTRENNEKAVFEVSL